MKTSYKIKTIDEISGGKDDTPEQTEEQQQIVPLIDGDVVVQENIATHKLGFGTISTMPEVSYVNNYKFNCIFTVKPQLIVIL